MLRIRHEQMAAFTWRTDAAIVRDLLPIVREAWPSATDGTTADDLAVRLRELVRRARALGFAQAQHVALYANLAVALGDDFDRSSALPWARAIFADGSIGPERKLAMLRAAAWRHFGR